MASSATLTGDDDHVIRLDEQIRHHELPFHCERRTKLAFKLIEQLNVSIPHRLATLRIGDVSCSTPRAVDDRRDLAAQRFS